MEITWKLQRLHKNIQCSHTAVFSPCKDLLSSEQYPAFFNSLLYPLLYSLINKHQLTNQPTKYQHLCDRINIFCKNSLPELITLEMWLSLVESLSYMNNMGNHLNLLATSRLIIRIQDRYGWNLLSNWEIEYFPCRTLCQKKTSFIHPFSQHYLTDVLSYLQNYSKIKNYILKTDGVIIRLMILEEDTSHNWSPVPLLTLLYSIEYVLIRSVDISKTLVRAWHHCLLWMNELRRINLYSAG